MTRPTRFIRAMIKAADAADALDALPFRRGARRKAFISKRQAAERTSASSDRVLRMA